jgi:alpha-beta hydrolase superfamily lysophospholipase
LQQQGYKVHAYDHHGHGRSDGKRGDLLSKDQLLQDAKRVLDAVRQNRPMVLLGHSLGGLVVASLLAREPGAAQAAVLSSPALAVSTGWLDKLLLATLPNYFPHLCVDNKLQINWLARDPEVVRAYQHDPLVHRKISAWLGAWIVEQGDAVRAVAANWQTPSLLMYAGQDKLVDPAGSRIFSQQVSSAVLQTHSYSDMYHEIFNDPDKEQVLNTMITWLNNRFS